MTEDTRNPRGNKMHDGKQVMRFMNNIKSKDLYNIGNELDKRNGTGNYDKERTKFNIQYRDLSQYNMYQEVKKYLDDNNIEYLHKNKTNMLNGVIFTSGPEFFQKLGLKFKETDRKHLDGSTVYVPDIKSEKDIPKKVIDYFDSCMEFLEKTVGKENIIRASAHFDEDTPHLQAYFLPIVHEVKRKCYQKDENGNLIKDINNKPILLRDNEGKMIYETVKGNFLNNDQFWKDLGGAKSFAKLQDEFNKFIKEKGFNLDRGNIGSNKHHTDKAEYQLKLNQKQLHKINQDILEQNIKFEETFNKLKEISKKDKEVEIKKLGLFYKNKDVEDLINYAYNLKQYHTYQEDFKEQLHSEKSYTRSLRNDIVDLKRQIYEKDKIIDKFSAAIGILKFGITAPFSVADGIADSEISALRHLNKENEDAAEEFYSMNKPKKKNQDNGMTI